MTLDIKNLKIVQFIPFNAAICVYLIPLFKKLESPPDDMSV